MFLSAGATEGGSAPAGSLGAREIQSSGAEAQVSESPGVSELDRVLMGAGVRNQLGKVLLTSFLIPNGAFCLRPSPGQALWELQLRWPQKIGEVTL